MSIGSVITSAMDMFRAPVAQPQQQQQPGPNATGQVSQQANPATIAGQVPQPNPQGTDGTPGQQTPEDKWKDLFTPLTAEQQAAQGRIDPSSLFAGMDAAKVQEAVGKMNFTAGISQEQLQAISAGGEGAVQTLQTLLNTTAQSAMSQSMLANAEMIKQALGQVGGSLDARIGTVSRNQQINNAVHAENPAFSSPAVRPMVDALTQAFSAKNPQATPAEISSSVKEYMNHVFSVANPQSSNQNKLELPAEFDFSDYLTRQ